MPSMNKEQIYDGLDGAKPRSVFAKLRPDCRKRLNEKFTQPFTIIQTLQEAAFAQSDLGVVSYC
jgi:hypothetical protein